MCQPKAALQGIEVILGALIWDDHVVFGIATHAAATSFFKPIRNGNGSNVLLQPRVFNAIQGCLINQPCQLFRGGPVSALRNKAGRRVNNDWRFL